MNPVLSPWLSFAANASEGVGGRGSDYENSVKGHEQKFDFATLHLAATGHQSVRALHA